MEKGYNVLSVFDGCSTGRYVLEKLGIPIENYFASEIDTYAMTVAQNNYLDTIMLGDVTKVDGYLLPKIDLLIGGSPCQGFSFAGKQLAFDDPRSRLFFEFVRLLKECKPKFFFLENVRMKKEHENVITELLGVQPVYLNSALVSAQNRKRVYWTNIPGYTEPEDRGLMLKDIVHEHCFTNRIKSNCVTAGFQQTSPDDYFRRKQGQMVAEPFALAAIKNKGVFEPRPYKSMCIDANYHKGPDNHGQRTVILTGMKRIDTATDIKGHDILKRIYSMYGKGPTLTAGGGGNFEPKIALDEYFWRKLTPIECERLQTLPDNYTIGVSNSQRYKMLGNGWTADAIAEFFKHLPPVEDLDLY